MERESAVMEVEAAHEQSVNNPPVREPGGPPPLPVAAHLFPADLAFEVTLNNTGHLQ
jgi:hypothetical protein